MNYRKFLVSKVTKEKHKLKCNGQGYSNNENDPIPLNRQVNIAIPLSYMSSPKNFQIVFLHSVSVHFLALKIKCSALLIIYLKYIKIAARALFNNHF